MCIRRCDSHLLPDVSIVNLIPGFRLTYDLCTQDRVQRLFAVCSQGREPEDKAESLYGTRSRWLYFIFLQVTEVRHLSGLPALEELYLLGNPVKQSSSHRCQVLSQLTTTAATVLTTIKLWISKGGAKNFLGPKEPLVCIYM